MSDDRLLRLGMARGVLRWARIESPEAFRRATPKQLADLGDHAAVLRRLIGEGRADVLAALFDPPDWYVALLLTDPRDRLLCVEGGERLIYCVDDTEGERRAWAAVKAARS